MNFYGSKMFAVVITYYLGALLISTGLLVPYLLFAQTSGSGKWFLLVAASGASLSALVTTAFFYGMGGIKSILRNLINVKIKYYWYLLAIFLMPVLLLFVSWVSSFFGINFDNPLQKIKSLVPVFIIVTLQAGLGEEIGWRGLMTPQLNKRMPLLAAAVLTGIFWGLWHTPLFFLENTFQFEIAKQIGFFSAFAWYALFLIASSVIYSFVVSVTNGSIFIACLFHGSLNTSVWLIGSNDVSRGVGGVKIFTLVTIVTAGLLFLITNKSKVWEIREE